MRIFPATWEKRTIKSESNIQTQQKPGSPSGNQAFVGFEYYFISASAGRPGYRLRHRKVGCDFLAANRTPFDQGDELDAADADHRKVAAKAEPLAQVQASDHV